MKCFSVSHQNILRISALKAYIYITVKTTKDMLPEELLEVFSSGHRRVNAS